MSEVLQKEYPIAFKGLATSYPESNTDSNLFSEQFTNLFINKFGNAEVRNGLSAHSQLPTNDNVTSLHEFIDKDENAIYFATAKGQIFKYNGSTWSLVYLFDNKTEIIYSYSMNRKIIFYNGVDRNISTTDGGEFVESRSTLERGRARTGTSANGLDDNTVSNWTTTGVSQFDLVYYTQLSAYGLVTSVLSSKVVHTPISAAGTGIGIGVEPSAHDPYQIIDMVELNGIPISGTNDFDNTGVLVTGSTTEFSVIRGISDHRTINTRPGDIIYNETRGRVTSIISASVTGLGHIAIASQAIGDEVTLLKSSMPITKNAHVHYNIAYLVDAREPSKIRISGPNNLENMGGTGAGTLDIADIQPQGEIIRTLASFQRFFLIGTSKNIYFYQGVSPVAINDSPADFEPKGSIFYGSKSKNSIASVGNDSIIVSTNGIIAASLFNASGSDQIVVRFESHQLDKELVRILEGTNPDNIQIIHYPKRSWAFCKIGEEIFLYNYSIATEFANTSELDLKHSAWHKFTGLLGRQKSFLITKDGDLLTGGLQGQIALFDRNTFNDLGEPIKFNYTTSWHNPDKELNNPAILPKISRKKGLAIKTYFEGGEKIPVSVKAWAIFDEEDTISEDEIAITAGSPNVIGIAVIGSFKIGSPRTRVKKSQLRWNGEQVKFSFIGQTSSASFVLCPYVIYYELMDYR